MPMVLCRPGTRPAAARPPPAPPPRRRPSGTGARPTGTGRPNGCRLLLAAQPKLVTPVLQVVHRVITRFLLGQAGATWWSGDE